MKMMKCVLLVLAGVCLPFATGCKSQEKSEQERELDRMWREGYGFNNPNDARRKKGLPPVDFK